MDWRARNVLDYELKDKQTCSNLFLANCTLRLPTDLFDKLKGLVTLRLHDVTIDEAFIASMLSTCTLLEGLTLKACEVVSSLIVAGSSSLRLKDLKVFGGSINNIEISAPNLISFEYSGNILLISSITAPRLLNVYFSTLQIKTLPHALAQFASHPHLETLSLYMHPHLVSAYINLLLFYAKYCLCLN
jgi:hypothetical protein